MVRNSIVLMLPGIEARWEW